MQSILTENPKPILPPMEADLWVSDNTITATMKDHTLRTYDLQGNIMDTFLVSSVENMVYESGELRYLKTRNGDEEGNLTDETEDENPTPVHKTARCKRYEAASGWYGLMSPSGKILTSPRYCDITAIDYYLYLCKTDDIRGEILKGNGIRVK